MTASDPDCRWFATVIGAIATLAFTGCEQAPPDSGTTTQDPPVAEAKAPAPAATPPGSGEAGADVSYEVAIASAAANRKRAIAACETRPETEREDCLAQVDADWEVTKSAVDDLRGEQQ